MMMTGSIWSLQEINRLLEKFLQSVDTDRFQIPPAETISYNVWNSK